MENIVWYIPNPSSVSQDDIPKIEKTEESLSENNIKTEKSQNEKELAESSSSTGENYNTASRIKDEEPAKLDESSSIKKSGGIFNFIRDTIMENFRSDQYLPDSPNLNPDSGSTDNSIPKLDPSINIDDEPIEKSIENLSIDSQSASKELDENKDLPEAKVSYIMDKIKESILSLKSVIEFNKEPKDEENPKVYSQIYEKAEKSSETQSFEAIEKRNIPESRSETRDASQELEIDEDISEKISDNQGDNILKKIRESIYILGHKSHLKISPKDSDEELLKMANQNSYSNTPLKSPLAVEITSNTKYFNDENMQSGSWMKFLPQRFKANVLASNAKENIPKELSTNDSIKASSNSSNKKISIHWENLTPEKINEKIFGEKVNPAKTPDESSSAAKESKESPQQDSSPSKVQSSAKESSSLWSNLLPAKLTESFSRMKDDSKPSK